MNYVRLALLVGAAMSLLGGRGEAQSLSAQLKAEGATALTKAAFEKGSDLTRMGKEATDAYLVEAMLFPSKVIRKGFESSTVVTLAGKIYTGRIVKQTPDPAGRRQRQIKTRTGICLVGGRGCCCASHC